ncbi:MAG: hypothetical protein ACLFUW_00295 [Bacteroidales bacterium]
MVSEPYLHEQLNVVKMALLCAAFAFSAEIYRTLKEKNEFKESVKKMPKKKSAKKTSRKSVVAKGVKIPKKKERAMEKKPGGSNVGEYKNVSPKDFAGPSGGAPKYSYPINTKKRAKAALSYARNAPNPSGIKRAVYKKYPELKKDKKK